MSERMNETCQMQLRFINAIVDGKEQMVSRAFSGVKLTATDDNLLVRLEGKIEGLSDSVHELARSITGLGTKNT